MLRMPWDKPYYEEITEQLAPKTETQEEMIVRLINAHEMNIETISVGERYYNKDTDILKQPFKRDLEGNIDQDKPDWRITTNYHQNLVDQKVAYLVTNPVTYSCDDEKALETIHSVLDTRWDNKLVDVLTSASNKGIDWVHPYINENGEFKLFRVPAEQAIPIWTDKEREDLQAFIRIFTLNGETKVEYWTDTDVTYYVYENGSLINDYYYGNDNVQSHFSTGSWEKVPFIPFKNNPEETSDIFMYKSVIDAIEKRISDTQNTFDESVELIYALSGYEGQDLSEFMEGLKYYKAITLDRDGKVETIQVDVPVTSTKEYLDMMRSNLIEYGQGVDFQTDKFGAAPSGIALKFLYGNLDLKANKLKNKTMVALQELIEFIVKFYKLNIDPKDIEITFNFNRMMNDVEESQIAVQSSGILSKQTIVSNHPWVKDPTAEMERIEQENIEYEQNNMNVGVDVEEEPEEKRQDTQQD